MRHSLKGDAYVVFAFESIAWALVLRGDLAGAQAILDEAIDRVPDHPGLAELREATARALSESLYETFDRRVANDVRIALEAA